VIGAAARFLRLQPADRALLLETLLALLGARLALSLLPFWRVYRRTSRPPEAPAKPAAADEARRIAWALRAAGRLVPACTCLIRALAAQALLRRRGEACRLRIGVTRGPQGAVQAHAWVEYRGAVLVGGAVDGFSVLPLA
jgi:hypothetical protein